MSNDETDFLGEYAQHGASAAQALDLPTTVRQLMRALAHLAVGGSLLWTVAAAASLANSL
ncbi:MAG TPA: hypothetical protein VNW90_12740 [Acetobacteraceae bacterium]|jgi:hypothetical protein|nr:hypothetical protein [Acetobacteraceae bacterium]